MLVTCSEVPESHSPGRVKRDSGVITSRLLYHLWCLREYTPHEKIFLNLFNKLFRFKGDSLG